MKSKKKESQRLIKEMQYCSLPKDRPWAEHLTSMPKRGVGALLSVSAFLMMKERSRYVYSDSIRVNALEANNEITGGLEVES